MGELLALATALLFATAANLMPRADRYLERNQGLLLSVLVNVLVNLGTVSLRIWLGPPLQISWAGLGWFVMAGLFTTLVGRWVWARAILFIGPSRATTWKASQVIPILAGGYFLLQEPVNWISLTGVALVLSGLYYLAAGERRQAAAAKAATGPGAGHPVGGAPGPEPLTGVARWKQGVLLGAATGLSFAFGNLARKAGILAWPEPLVAALVGATAAAVGFRTLPGAGDVWRQAWRAPVGRGHLWWGLVGLATSGAQLCLFFALLHAPVYVVHAIVGIEPLLTPLLGMAMLQGGERRGARLWGSAVLVTAGVVAVALR